MSMPDLPPLPPDILDMLNARRGRFVELIGMHFTRATYDVLEAEIPVTPVLYQPYGLVHGGVYSTIVETLASTAGLINGMYRNYRIVGMENSTSFLRATRDGILRGRTTPLVRGRRTQVWRVAIENDDGQLAASGKVRLLVVNGGDEVGNETVVVEEGQI